MGSKVACSFPGPLSVGFVAFTFGALVSAHAEWDNRFRAPGLDGSVADLEVAAGNVYVTGGFRYAGMVKANAAVGWDGRNWFALEDGLKAEGNTPWGHAIAVQGTNVYLGGYFTNAGSANATNIALWNGHAWAALGPGVGNKDSGIFALVFSGTNLYAGGTFTNSGSTLINNIARWDGHDWRPVGSGLDGTVTTLAADGDAIYAAGFFTHSGSSSVTNLAKWDGLRWSAVGTKYFNGIYALLVTNHMVLVAGQFPDSTGTFVTDVARWDGTNWINFNSNLEWFSPFDLIIYQNQLIAAGHFAIDGNPQRKGVAQWNGTFWTPIGGGVGREFEGVNCLATDGERLFAGGNFSRAGIVNARNVALWNGQTWSVLDSGVEGPSGSPFALTVSGTNVYVGGTFSDIGGMDTPQIAKWDGDQWLSAGTQTGEWLAIRKLAAFNGEIYAVGDYLSGGLINEPTARLSKWNRTNWVHISAVPCRSRGSINALWASDAYVYVAGLFGLSCEESGYVLLKGDGTNWSTVAGVDGQVYAILESGTNLYVGGRFSSMGGDVAPNVARWDGVRWSSIGGGIRNDRGDAYVSALAIDDDRLFVGGFFQFAGSAPANNVACWNGSEWSALGSGVNDYVRSLAVIDHDLYVGGNFSRAGGVPASHVARWDGTNWAALGSGTSHSVHALAANGDALFVSGDFTEAGGQPSIRFAIWYARPELRAGHILNTLELSWPLFGSNYVLESSERMDVPTWNEVSSGRTPAGDRWTVHQLPTDLRQFYRLRRKQP